MSRRHATTLVSSAAARVSTSFWSAVCAARGDAAIAVARVIVQRGMSAGLRWRVDILRPSEPDQLQTASWKSTTDGRLQTADGWGRLTTGETHERPAGSEHAFCCCFCRRLLPSAVCYL